MTERTWCICGNLAIGTLLISRNGQLATKERRLCRECLDEVERVWLEGGSIASILGRRGKSEG